MGLQQLAGEGERGAGVVELVVEHRRPDAVGADARDVHVLDLGCPQVGHGAQAEPHDGVLRGGVDPLAGHGGEAGERGDVDDLATAVGTHRLDGGQRAVHRPDRIHLDHQAALLLVVLPRGAGEEHAGVVDPDVQSTGDGDDPIARGTHGRVVTDVERESRRWLAELARHLLRRRLVEVGDEHPVAPLHEKAGDLPPQAAAGAGDDGAGRPPVRLGAHRRAARIVPCSMGRATVVVPVRGWVVTRSPGSVWSAHTHASCAPRPTMARPRVSGGPDPTGPGAPGAGRVSVRG